MDIHERSNRERRRCEQRSGLLAGLRNELMTHLLAEQKALCDTLLARLDAEDLLLDSLEEHDVVEAHRAKKQS
jgi:hypothetical protein